MWSAVRGEFAVNTAGVDHKRTTARPITGVDYLIDPPSIVTLSIKQMIKPMID